VSVNPRSRKDREENMSKRIIRMPDGRLMKVAWAAAAWKGAKLLGRGLLGAKKAAGNAAKSLAITAGKTNVGRKVLSGAKVTGNRAKWAAVGGTLGYGSGRMARKPKERPQQQYYEGTEKTEKDSCPKCKITVPDGSTKCPRCGTAIKTIEVEKAMSHGQAIGTGVGAAIGGLLVGYGVGGRILMAGLGGALGYGLARLIEQEEEGKYDLFPIKCSSCGHETSAIMQRGGVRTGLECEKCGKMSANEASHVVTKRYREAMREASAFILDARVATGAHARHGQAALRKVLQAVDDAGLTERRP